MGKKGFPKPIFTCKLLFILSITKPINAIEMQ
jgi:hypothetical protein